MQLKRSKGEPIRYTHGPCALGTLLLASREQGVCAVFWGDDSGALLRDLASEFVGVPCVADDRGLAPWLGLVQLWVEQPTAVVDVPLNVQGTPFQLRVWQALQDIPVGQTCTYTELALRVGSPRAVRAVAGACAANRLAGLIPCHRVVRSDGALAGYRWGVARKQALLARERSQGL